MLMVRFSYVYIESMVLYVVTPHTKVYTGIYINQYY